MEVSSKRGKQLHASCWCPSMILFWDICWPIFLTPAKCVTSFCWIIFFNLYWDTIWGFRILSYGFFFQVFISHNHSKLFLTEVCLWSALFLSISITIPLSLLLLQFLPDLIHTIIHLCLDHSSTSLLSQSTAAWGPAMMPGGLTWDMSLPPFHCWSAVRKLDMYFCLQVSLPFWYTSAQVVFVFYCQVSSANRVNHMWNSNFSCKPFPEKKPERCASKERLKSLVEDWWFLERGTIICIFKKWEQGKGVTPLSVCWLKLKFLGLILE